MTDVLISRQATIDAFTCKGSIFTYGADECKTIVSRIMMVPPAQPESKTAYWTKDAVGSIVCSKCGGIRKDNRIGHMNFCNCCGAKMRGEQDANNF